MFSMDESTVIAENTLIFRSFLRLAKISPKWAPFSIPLSGKPRKTVRFGAYGNTFYSRSVCQNKGELHLS